MSQLAVQTVDATFPLQKQTRDRLDRVIHILNANLSLTEATAFSGQFDVFNKAGVPVPDAAPGAMTDGAGNLTGDYSWAVTLYFGGTDSMGNPGATVALTTLSSNKVAIDLTTITNERVNSRATHFDIWRTLGAGSTGIFFFVARVPIETVEYEDNSSDATIQANDTLQTDNDRPLDGWRVAKAHKGYMFNIGGDGEFADDFTHSKLSNADASPLLYRVKIEPGRYGPIVTMEDSGDACLFYKKRAIYELHFDEHPSGVFGDGFGKTINTRFGCLNPRTCVNVQGTHIVMDEERIYINSGGTGQQPISVPLKRIWQRINFAAQDWFWGAADDETVVFFVALDGESLPRHALVFDLNAWYARQPAVWTMYEYDAAIIDGTQHRFGNGGAAEGFGLADARVIAVMTEYGHTGYLRAGYRDFLDHGLTARGTVTGSAGAGTFADSAATFERNNDQGDVVDAVGCHVFFKLGDSDQTDSRGWTIPYRITSHPTSASCNFSPNAPSAIPVGTEYVIGRIPNARIYTPVIGGEAPFRMKRAARTALSFQPLPLETELRMSISLDRKAPEATALSYESGEINAVQYEQGIPVKVGGSLQSGGRKGVHATPAEADAFHSMQVILEAPEVDGPVVVDGIYIDGLFDDIAEVP